MFDLVKCESFFNFFKQSVTQSGLGMSQNYQPRKKLIWQWVPIHLVPNMMDSLKKSNLYNLGQKNPSWQKTFSYIQRPPKKHVYPSRPMDPLDRRPPEVDATQSKPGKLAHFVLCGGRFVDGTSPAAWQLPYLRWWKIWWQIGWRRPSKSSSLEVFWGTCLLLQEVINMKL